MNKTLKIRPVGNRRSQIGLHDLSFDKCYHSWVEAARLYRGALRNAASAPPHDPAGPLAYRVLTLRLDGANLAAINVTLRGAHDALDPGDMLVVDIPMPISGRDGNGSERDLISRVLFEAGFDRPIIWAGRKILEARESLVRHQSSVAVDRARGWTAEYSRCRDGTQTAL